MGREPGLRRLSRLAAGAAAATALLVAGQAAAATADELLPPGEAFRVTARAAGAERIVVTWDIAPDYYMYQGRYAFRLEDSPHRLGTPSYPPGEEKTDEFFGDVVIHRGTVRVALPVERAGGAASRAVLVATGQGCNEPVGVCYPPHTQRIALSLPARADAGAASGGGLTGRLRDLAGLGSATGESRFLPVDEAFRIAVFAEDGAGLRADVEIADGYYLYRDKLAFSTPAGGVKLAEPVLPAGVRKRDEYFGETEVYYGRIAPRIPLEAGAAGELPGRIPVQVSFQGCAEDGICYPPATRTVEVALGGAGAGPAAGAGAGAFWPYLLAAFGTGLLLTFTPCVLPMIPIVSGIVAGEGGGRLRGGTLSAVFVLGTAVTYTATGAVAGATGEQLQAYFQSPWIIGTGALALMVMAAATAGFVHVQMPHFIQSHVHARVGRLESGPLWVPFLAGMLSALVVGACVSPLLISALGVALAAGDPWLGGAIMFSMALGMGVLLVLVGFGAGALLPRAGSWMHRVRELLAFALAGVAVYLLGVIPQVPVMWLWALLVGAFAAWLLRLALPGPWRWLGRGAAGLAAAWAVVLVLAGVAGGMRDPLTPLAAGWSPGAGGGAPAAAFQEVSTTAALDAALRDAQADGKAVFIDYFAEWCIDCLRMERSTFRDPEIRALLGERFVALRIDVTDAGDPQSRALKQRFGVYGPPAMLFFDPRGNELRELRLYGYRDAAAFLPVLRQALPEPGGRVAGEQDQGSAAGSG